MKKLLLIVVLLPGLAVAQQCNLQFDCIGNSLMFDVVDSHRDCLDLCSSVEGCEWYTYDSSDGFCNSLSDCDERDPSCTTCISGENECQLPLMCFVQGQCHGSYIDHVDVATAEECLERCHNDYPDCKYFSFFIEDGVCTFLESCYLDEAWTEVVSGERACYEVGQQAHTKIFLQSYTSTEWIHMPSTNDGTGCSPLPAYPLSLTNTVADIINGSLTVCGGYSDACFSLDAGLNIWTEFLSLNVERGGASGAITSKGWWITGGGNPAISSSSLFNGSSWSVGPDIPSPRRAHCMVQVNETHTFMAGGGTGAAPFSDAFMFDWTTEVWTRLDNMPTGVSYFGCAVYDGSVITAGGETLQRKVASFDLESEEWRSLPDLPTTVSYGFLIHDNGDLILGNGYYGGILRFNPGNKTFSIIQGQTLPLTGAVTAVPVADVHLSGCN